MAGTTAHRWLTIAVLVACSAFGGYATFGAASHNGLFDALRTAAGPQVPPAARHLPGGPKPYKISYTGVAAIDERLLLLIAFFTIVLDGPKTHDAVVVLSYLTTQLLAGWVLVTLEGLRKGNRGRAVSWTGTLGFVFQNVTYTVSVPLYLVLHLLTSPTSSTAPAPAAFAIDTHDLYVLPLSVAGAFVLPTVMMALPSPATVAPAAHYTWQALWQIFPVAQSVSHGVYKRLTAALPFKADFPQQLDDVYRATALLAFAPHTALLAVAATPAHRVPAAVLRAVPGLTRELFARVDVARAFVPCWPWDSPVVAVPAAAKAVAVKGLPELVELFLRWDITLGGTALLAWAVFVYSVARPGKPLLSSTLPRVAVYTALGGPAGAATMLLWERDAAARQRGAPRKG